MARGRGTLVVRFIGDINDLQQKARAARRTVSQAGDGLVEAGKKLTLGLTVPFALGAVKAVSASSALGEAVSANTVVFGENAQAAERWGRSMAEAAGLSARVALSARAAFGNMFNTVGLGRRESLSMSKVLVQLAGDMASFSDQDPSEMLEKLRSGLAGEAEPLRRFGVLLTEAKVKAKAMELGLADANGEVSEAAKVQARYAIILDETKIQQGDVARTSGSVANQMRITRSETENAAASFGKVLEPVSKRLLQTTQAIVSVFEALPGPVKTGVVAIAGIGAAVGPVLVVAGKIRQTRAELKLLEQQGALSRVSLTRLGRLGVHPVSVAVGAAIGLYSIWAKGKENLERATVSLTDAIQQEKDGIAGAVDQAIVAELRSRKLLDDMRKAQVPLKRVLGFVRGELSLTDDELKRLNHTIGVAGFLGQELTGNYAGAGHQVEELRKAFQAGEIDAAQIAEALGATGKKAAALGEATKEAGRDIRLFAGMTSDEFKKWREDTISAINPADDALAELANQARVTAADILKSFKDQVRTLKDYEKNWRNLLDRGMPEEMARDLQEMGVDGARVVAALAAANKREWAGIVKNWESVGKRAPRIGNIIKDAFPSEIKIPISFVSGQRDLLSRLGAISKNEPPKHHTGGTFHAPHGQLEGLALLRDGERVLTPGQQNLAGGFDNRALAQAVSEGVASALRGLRLDVDADGFARLVSERIGRSAARLSRTA